ncbi:MAG TPA: hypothetical protein VFG14_15285, partial [Chthoniobacteraceae bacterium]|nr:hypothetical protein [Chthoniobacteraceae bacterium]
TRPFWMRQLRIYIHGLAHVRGMEIFEEIRATDEVEVISLHGRDSSRSTGPDRVGDGYTVVGRKMLKGDDARLVMNIFLGLPTHERYALCHNPGYGLRFRGKGRLIFETTVCWECENLTIPIGVFGSAYRGFEGDSQNSKHLLETLKSHVPLAVTSSPAKN